MTTAVQPAGGGGGGGGKPSPTGLADVIDSILDKGLVIDAYVRVSLVGIELVTIDARVVIASVDTYLRFAEAVNRLDIQGREPENIPELMHSVTEGGAKRKAVGALESAKESLFGSDEENEEDDGRSADEEHEDEREGDRTRTRAPTATRRRGK